MWELALGNTQPLFQEVKPTCLPYLLQDYSMFTQISMAPPNPRTRLTFTSHSIQVDSTSTTASKQALSQSSVGRASPPQPIAKYGYSHSQQSTQFVQPHQQASPSLLLTLIIQPTTTSSSALESPIQQQSQLLTSISITIITQAPDIPSLSVGQPPIPLIPHTTPTIWWPSPQLHYTPSSQGYPRWPTLQSGSGFLSPQAQ